jgi:prepilin-type N-terminal cleavage/methylation domain-containing protein
MMLTRLHRRLRRALRPQRAGFSLVEIMMVLIIISVGIIPIAVVQHRARREVTESDRYTQAVTVAQAQLERIKGRGFGVAAADSGADGNINWNAQVTNVAFGLDRVEVTASWTNNDGAQSVTIADLVSMR